MLTAARTVIAQNCRKVAGPSIGEWVCEMNEMQSLELIKKTEAGLREQSLRIWQQWDQFRTSATLSKYI